MAAENSFMVGTLYCLGSGSTLSGTIVETRVEETVWTVDDDDSG
jgi:hypothetical protein